MVVLLFFLIFFDIKKKIMDSDSVLLLSVLLLSSLLLSSLLLLLLLLFLYVDVIKWCYNVRGKGLSQKLVDEAATDIAKSDVGVYEGSMRGL